MKRTSNVGIDYGKKPKRTNFPDDSLKRPSLLSVREALPYRWAIKYPANCSETNNIK